MGEYVRLETRNLLRHLKVQVKQAARKADADAVHDLRVAIRRLNRCLRAFAQFYPAHSWKPVRRQLKAMMTACGNVRDRDIAIGLMTEAGLAASSPVVRKLERDRSAARQELRRELGEWIDSDFARRWRQKLDL